VSRRKRGGTPVVRREYAQDPDYCTEALMLILKKSVNQKAGNPARWLTGSREAV
jgi:hypothetical protein